MTPPEDQPANGISLLTPSAPCTCIARHAMSCSTVGMTTLRGDVLAHALVVVVLVDLPRGVEDEQPDLL